jgi:hypothetical protein
MPYLVLDPTLAQIAPTLAFGAPETAANHPMGKSLVMFRNRLKLELGNRTDIPDALWNEWINDSYLDLWTSIDLPERRTSFGLMMTAAQPFYALPVSVDGIRAISATDPSLATIGGPLVNTDAASYRKLPVRSGDPEMWFREKNMLVVWPTPSRAFPISIDITLSPAPLVIDTDYPILEDKWHDALYRLAKARAWDAVQNDVKAGLNTNEAARLVQRRLSRDEEDSETKYPTIRPVTSRREFLNPRRHPHRGDS